MAFFPLFFNVLHQGFVCDSRCLSSSWEDEEEEANLFGAAAGRRRLEPPYRDRRHHRGAPLPLCGINKKDRAAHF